MLLSRSLSNQKMKKERLNNAFSVLFTLVSLFLLSCSETQKDTTQLSTISLDTTATIAIVTPIEDSQLNCYNHLTELVRSSNFPFKGIDKSNVNLLIDTEERDLIFAKVFFETQGSGTLGWVNYHVKKRTLENASADLDTPQKLEYDVNYAVSFEKCLGVNYDPTSKEITSLEDAYNQATLVSLPNNYDYDFILEQKGFVKISKETSSSLNLKDLENLKLAKLSVIGNYLPILVSANNSSGQSQLFLFVLSKDYKALSHIKLYDSQEIDAGSISTTYSISPDYKIDLKESKLKDVNGKVEETTIKASRYSLSEDGKIVEVK